MDYLAFLTWKQPQSGCHIDQRLLWLSSAEPLEFLLLLKGQEVRVGRGEGEREATPEKLYAPKSCIFKGQQFFDCNYCAIIGSTPRFQSSWSCTVYWTGVLWEHKKCVLVIAAGANTQMGGQGLERNMEKYKLCQVSGIMDDFFL